MTDDDDKVIIPECKVALSDLPILPSGDDHEVDEEVIQDLCMVRRTALAKLGISDEIIERLEKLRVLNAHNYLTCNDYNL